MKLEKDIAWVNEVWYKIEQKLNVVSKKVSGKIPYTTIDGIYDDKNTEDNIHWWTNGFWGGLMWLMYINTGNEWYKSEAENNERMLDNAFRQYDRLHHDVGFMWDLTAGVAYRLNENKESYLRAMYAANILAGRYNVEGGYIRAWNHDRTGWAIIDCMMNLALLYRASQWSGDDRYKYIAMKHADKTMQYHIRKDGSSNHIVVYNPTNGEVVESLRGQGYDADSSWSRGQSWALYGFTLSYGFTGKQEYLDTAKRVANYYIANVCDDFLPKCDFRAPEEPVIYDSTSGAIAASGLLELTKYVGENEKKTYYKAAINLLRTMEQNFCNWDLSEQAILMKGTEAYHKDNGKHIPIVYGDYFFVEAIAKLRGNEFLMW